MDQNSLAKKNRLQWHLCVSSAIIARASTLQFMPTIVIAVKCHRESHSKMLTKSLLERERFDKRPVEAIIVAQKYAQLVK